MLIELIFTVIEEWYCGDKGSPSTKGVIKYMNLFGLWKFILMAGNKEYKTKNNKELVTLLTEI